MTLKKEMLADLLFLSSLIIVFSIISVPFSLQPSHVQKLLLTLHQRHRTKIPLPKAFGMKYLLLPILALMFACGGTSEEVYNEDEGPVEDSHHGQQLLDLSEHGYPFSLWVPTQEVSGAAPLATFDDSFMHVKLVAGKRFQMLVRQEPPGLERLKMALKNDPIRIHETIEEAPHMLIYKTSFPDQEVAFVHFYYAFEVNGEPYIAEDVKEAELNEADIDKMIEALKDLELPV